MTQELLNARFVFIIGGPGCGEKTVSKTLEEKGFTTVSMRQVLMEEVQARPESSVKIKEAMAVNELVSLNTVIKLLKEHLLSLCKSTSMFCIHGFPRDIDQVNKFDNEIAKTEMALYLKVSDQTMKIRYKQTRENEGIRVDEAVLEKKVRLFREKQLKCLEFYIKRKKLCQIDAEVPVVLVCRNALKCLNKKISE